ncbi:hypothetical protein Tco_1441043, partial [Tanacetum coccineum]
RGWEGKFKNMCVVKFFLEGAVRDGKGRGVRPLNELNEPNETHLEITDNEVNEDDMLGQSKRMKKRSSWLKDFLRSQPRLYSPYPPLLPTPSTQLTTLPKTTTSKLPFRRLTQSEMAERREKGLCYNCDKKYTSTRNCKSKFMLMVVPDDDQSEFRTYEDPTEDVDKPPRVSYHALTGAPYPHTLRVTGQINGQASSFPVMVGNGDHLHSKGVCLDIPLRIKDYFAKVDLYLLPIKGAELVLGV